MRRLTVREKILVCTASMMAGGFLGYYTLMIPGNIRYAEAAARLDMLRSRKAGIEAGISGLEARQSMYEHRQEQLREGRKVFLQVTDNAHAELKVLEYLEHNRIKPEETAVGGIEEREIIGSGGEKAYIYAAAVHICATGKWADFGSLMEQVSQDTRIRILAFEVKEMEKGSFDRGGDLSITMDVEYYMLNSQKKPGSDVKQERGS